MFSDHFEKEIEKSTLTARDVLEQLFNDNSDFSGSDSGGEGGEAVFACLGPSFSTSTLEQDLHLDETDSCKC